jgi:hypothetical protein
MQHPADDLAYLTVPAVASQKAPVDLCAQDPVLEVFGAFRGGRLERVGESQNAQKKNPECPDIVAVRIVVILLRHELCRSRKLWNGTV